MTAGKRKHEVVVTAWLERVPRGAPIDLIEAFEHTFTALWRRARVTLGDVTLGAIVERVLDAASQMYPALITIVVDDSGLNCEGLRAAENQTDDQLRAALGYVLVEFLAVLGNLTAQVLTPALHRELASIPAEVTKDAAR